MIIAMVGTELLFGDSIAGVLVYDGIKERRRGWKGGAAAGTFDCGANLERASGPNF
jgi:hypothetical protein